MSATAIVRKRAARLAATRLGTFLRLVRLLWTVDARMATFLAGQYALGGLFPVANVALLRQLVDTAQAVLQGSAPLLSAVAWAGAIALLNILNAGSGWGRNVIAGRFQELLRLEIERRCYDHVQTMPLEALEQPDVHDQLRRTRQGLQERLFNVLTYSWQSLSEIVTLLSLLLYLGRFHWSLPLLLAAGSTPGILIATNFLHRRYLLDRKQTPEERRFGIYDDLLTGRRAAAELRVFSFGPWLAERALQLWRGLAVERLQVDAAEARMIALTSGLNALTYALAIAIGVTMLLGGRLGLGVAAALFYAVEGFQSSYQSIAQYISAIANGLRYVQDFFAFVDGPRLDLAAGRPFAGGISQGITFDHVSFAYPGSATPALQEVSFTLRPGERLALVGENGAGKSTLVKVLMGLYRPTGGRILVDGIDLQAMAPADWHRRIGAIFQDFGRYQTTLRHNIGIGWVGHGGDPALLNAAAARSGALEVAAALPRGLDTPLGKEFHDGAELSTGQWQKLAIARAYLRPAELLILDEPASALDAKAEAEVYAHFAEVTAGRMAVLVSHRLGSCHLADRILVLQHGRLAEEGTHEHLLALGGTYAELYRLQAEWYR